MSVLRKIGEKIKTGLARGLTEVPRFIRKVGEKVKNIPVLGTIAKAGYEALVPKGIRTGISTGLDVAEKIGLALGGEPQKPNYSAPEAPTLTKPRAPPPPPPGKKSSGPPSAEEIRESKSSLKAPGLRKPTGPLPMPPSGREQMLDQIRRKAIY